MKQLLFYFLFFCSININAQTELATTFNSTHSGRNIALSISKTYSSKNEFGGGVRYNLGMLAMPDDQNNVFYKRLYPSEFYQNWGIIGYYHRYILKKWEYVRPFLFYDIQATYSTTRNRTLTPTGYAVDGHNLYVEYIDRWGPFTWIEQNIGIGFKADLTDRFFIMQKIGFGNCFILGKDTNGYVYDNERVILLDKYFNWFTTEFGGIIHIGVGYRFK